MNIDERMEALRIRIAQQREQILALKATSLKNSEMIRQLAARAADRERTMPKVERGR